MVHVKRTFVVDGSVAEVTAYLADFTNAEQWDPGTQRCTRIDDGPVEVGSTWHNTSRVLGMETQLEYRLQELDAGRIVFVGRNKTATSTDDITIREHESGSEITYRATVELHGAAKLSAPIMQLQFEKLGNDTVRGIREAVAGL